MSASEQRAVAAEPDEARRQLGRLTVVIMLVAIVVPFATTFTMLWSHTGDDLDTARREQAGITEFRPLIQLLSATVDAQTTAVAGAPPRLAPLRAAVTAVDEADAAVGSGLGTDRRWTDLKTRLGHLSTSNTRGSAAYTSFSQLIDLELALLTAVNDASGLPLDPALDSHYLADAVTERMPALIVNAGRISDLSLLLEQRKAPVQPNTLAVAVAQAELRSAANHLDDELRKGFEDTASHSLGPALLRELDRLQDAATDLAPPLSAVGGTPVLRSAAATGTAAGQLRDATVVASAAGLDRLTALVDDRAQAAAATRRIAATLTGAGAAVVALVLWLATGRRRDEAEDVPDTSTVSADPDLPHTEAWLPRSGARLPQADVPEEADEGLIEARELLRSPQVIRVGRAVSAVRAGDRAAAEEDS